MHDTLAPPAGLHGTEWGWFFLLIVFLLAFDLFVVNRKAHVIPMREAAGWSVFWIAVALVFNGWVWWKHGAEHAALFFQAYVTEKALSIDNLFIFLVVFTFFKVDKMYRHRVLFYGILGALVMRGIFIVLGVEILERFSWSFYGFGALLLFTAWKLLRGESEKFEPEQSWIYRLGRRVLPLVPEYEGGKFFVKRNGKTVGTTMLLVLFVIEGTDVMFALDSVPACIGITRDLFIVYTSNVFAILGLRALYFLVEGGLQALPGLQTGLALVLAYIGLKMMGEPLGFHIDTAFSLGILVALLGGSCLMAWVIKSKEPPGGPGSPA